MSALTAYLENIYGLLANHRWISAEKLSMMYVDDVDSIIRLIGDDVEELCLLQTCHRVEYYLVARRDVHVIMDKLDQYYWSAKGIRARDYVKVVRGADLIRHIMRVSAGLESAIIGEHEVLGQLKRAYEQFLRSGHLRGVLKFIIERAIRFGKYVRAHTNISRGPRGFGSLTVYYLRGLYGDLSNVRLLVVGAGELGSTLVKELHDAGARSIVVLSRTLKRASEVASMYGCAYDVLTQESIARYLLESDVCVFAVTVREPVLTKSLAEQLDRLPLIIDLCVPRCVEGELSRRARVLTIDDLSRLAQELNKEKLSEVAKVERLLEDEVRRTMQLLKRRVIEIEVGKILKILDDRRAREVEKSIRRGLFSESSAQDLDVVTRSVYSKSTKPFVEAIKSLAEEDVEMALKVLRKVYDVIEREYKDDENSSHGMRRRVEGPKR